MHSSNVKIITKLLNLKTTFIKTGIILSLAVYWGVILVGTFITFNEFFFLKLTELIWKYFYQSRRYLLILLRYSY